MAEDGLLSWAWPSHLLEEQACAWPTGHVHLPQCQTYKRECALSGPMPRKGPPSPQATPTGPSTRRGLSPLSRRNCKGG